MDIAFCHLTLLKRKLIPKFVSSKFWCHGIDPRRLLAEPNGRKPSLTCSSGGLVFTFGLCLWLLLIWPTWCFTSIKLLPPKVFTCRNKKTLEANKYLFIFKCFKIKIIVWGFASAFFLKWLLTGTGNSSCQCSHYLLWPNGMWEVEWNFWVLCT